LAATYVTFSPDGQELLVNLGGEQIYLFDVNRGRKAEKFDISMVLAANGIVKGRKIWIFVVCRFQRFNIKTLDGNIQSTIKQ